MRSVKSQTCLATSSHDNVPEWGDPYQYPAGYDDFVSFHPPGSEGWPYPHLAYLRPWNPPGASTSQGNYDIAAWPITNGYLGEVEQRARGTAYPLTNQPIFNLSGSSRPGPIMGPGPWQLLPRQLIVPSTSDVHGNGYVDLNPKIQHFPAEPNAFLDISSNTVEFLSSFGPKTLATLTTVPPCKWMELEHPRYPWKIRVTAQVPRQGCLGGVSIQDVLTAISDDLQKEVSPTEAHSVSGTTDAFKRQRSASWRHTDGRSRTPLKRLHWLGSQSVQFFGISPHTTDPARWIMHFGHDQLPEKPLPPLPQEDSPVSDDPPEYPWGEQEHMRAYEPIFVWIQQADGQLRAVQMGRDACPPTDYPRDQKRRRRRQRYAALA